MQVLVGRYGVEPGIDLLLARIQLHLRTQNLSFDLRCRVVEKIILEVGSTFRVRGLFRDLRSGAERDGPRYQQFGNPVSGKRARNQAMN